MAAATLAAHAIGWGEYEMKCAMYASVTGIDILRDGLVFLYLLYWIICRNNLKEERIRNVYSIKLLLYFESN